MTLRQEVARSTGRALVLAAASLAIGLVTALALIGANDRGSALMDTTRQARAAHETMLHEMLAVRGYLINGDERFLGTYETVGVGVSSADAAVVDELRGDPDLAGLAVATRAAAADWRTHARSVIRGVLPVGSDLVAFAERDDELFEDYEHHSHQLMDALTVRRNGVLSQARWTLLLGGGAQLVMLATLVVSGAVHRRRLVAGVVEPVQDFERVISEMASGDLSARPEDRGYAELRSAGQGLSRLGDSLVNEQQRAVLRSDLLTLQAERFRQLVEVSQEIASAADVPSVLDAVVGAARQFTGWSLVSVHLAAGGERTTADAAIEPGRAVFPMAFGGEVIGALEIMSDRADAALPADLVEVLLLLAGQGAAAMHTARLHARLADESRRDALTGLPNRRRLDEDLEREVARARRYGRDVAVLLLDLDHFKRVNDTLGHQVGDDVLRATADIVVGSLRATDTAYRFGGEEMVVLLRDTDDAAATEVAERLRSSIEESETAGVRVTTSVGVAGLADADDAATFLTRADAALYRAKRTGRNRVVAATAPVVV